MHRTLFSAFKTEVEIIKCTAAAGPAAHDHRTVNSLNFIRKGNDTKVIPCGFEDEYERYGKQRDDVSDPKNQAESGDDRFICCVAAE